MPLESNTVRFIDNFSRGKRGASSVEYFLREECAVIFLYRKKSLEPFVRHFTVEEFLGWMQGDQSEGSSEWKCEFCLLAKL